MQLKLPKLLSVLTVTTVAAAMVTTTAPHATAQQKPAIAWEDCPKSVERPGARCGRIDVPQNYADPQGKKISVGFIQFKATNGAKDTIFTNPGGPGGDVYGWLGTTDMTEFPAEFFANYDIIGVQPRGLNGSTPLECSDTSKLGPADQFTQSGEAIRKACETSHPGYPAQITTENTARDWDEVRKALGKDTISIYGLSYGTLLGSTYATLFPKQTNKVVLDSGLNASNQWSHVIASQEAGYNTALQEFFNWAALNDDKFHLGTTPYAVYTKWAQAIQAQSGVWPSVTPPKATAADLPPHSSGVGQAAVDIINGTEPAHSQAKNLGSQLFAGGRNQSHSSVLGYTFMRLPMPRFWESIVETIHNPDLATQKLIPKEPTEEDAKAFIHSFNMRSTIMCNEAQSPWNPQDIPRALWTNYVIADVIQAGPSLFNSGLVCNGAAPITKGVPFNGSALKTRPLQIQATRDPQTPYGDFWEMQKSMNSHLITVNGPGHSHFGVGNKAVDKVVLDYFRTGAATTSELPGYFG